VHLPATVGGRLDTAIEAAAYFLVSEALTNAAKHAQAETISVDVVRAGDTLVVTVTDDGLGGVDPGQGSGLRGLVDRVDAVGGRLDVSSAPGEGTRVCARLPTHVLGLLNGH
jgi:signal transduction histidine kinase